MSNLHDKLIVIDGLIISREDRGGERKKMQDIRKIGARRPCGGEA